MKNYYEEFENIIIKHLQNIVSGREDYINFQIYGFSQEDVKRYWRRMKRHYSLPRAKRIESATISF